MRNDFSKVMQHMSSVFSLISLTAITHMSSKLDAHSFALGAKNLSPLSTTLPRAELAMSSPSQMIKLWNKRFKMSSFITSLSCAYGKQMGLQITSTMKPTNKTYLIYASSVLKVSESSIHTGCPTKQLQLKTNFTQLSEWLYKFQSELVQWHAILAGAHCHRSWSLSYHQLKVYRFWKTLCYPKP